MLKVLEFAASIVFAVVMTGVMIAVIYGNRSTLPVVGVFFCVLIAFGLLI